MGEVLSLDEEESEAELGGATSLDGGSVRPVESDGDSSLMTIFRQRRVSEFLSQPSAQAL